MKAKKKPIKLVAMISGGVLLDVLSNTPMEFELCDMDNLQAEGLDSEARWARWEKMKQGLHEIVY